MTSRIVVALSLVLALVLGVGVMAARAASTTVTVDRIVLYTGNDDKTPVGPEGPLAPVLWKTDTVPKEIHTNDGTLVEDTSLVYCCGTNGGEWWFNKSQAVLHVFHWEQKDGDTVEATNLASILNNNNAWYNLGDNTYSPRCMEWGTPSGLHYIQLTKPGGDWETTTHPCDTAP